MQRDCQVCGLSRDDAMVRGRWRKLIRMVDEHTIHVLISLTDLCAQSMHFLCLEPRETVKNVLKLPEIY